MSPILLLVLTMVSCTSGEVFSVDKGVIVHLFEWRYSDIARECEEFLAPNGFKGVQISPPSENVKISQPYRPWWERYQPISYRLVSRSGDEKELENMVDRCNKVRVRVFADVVLNHMSGPSCSEEGVGGSTATPDSFNYPSIPFGWGDFHQPPCDVMNYNNAIEVRVCQIKHLRDLNNTMENVRQRQAEFFNKLVDRGVGGFSIQAAKHIYPEDLKDIYDRVKNLNPSKCFPANTRPLIYQEVFDMGGEAVTYQEYAPLGLVTDFRYGRELGRSFQGLSDLVHLKTFGSSWNLLPDDTGVVFVDNHDTQRRMDPATLTYKKARPYKMALAFMLAFPYGTPKVLSSYKFDSYDQGPPHDSDFHTLSPQPNKDNLCTNGWVCEHRWRQLYNMVQFHNTVKGTSVDYWWDNDKNQISFCRGNKGFIAFNTETSQALDRELQTCLPPGKYCDVISGNLVDNSCTGSTVEVGADGMARITIRPFNMDDPNAENDNVLALHVKASVLTVKSASEEMSDDHAPLDDSKVSDRSSPVVDEDTDDTLENRELKQSVAENTDVTERNNGKQSLDADNSDNSVGKSSVSHLSDRIEKNEVKSLAAYNTYDRQHNGEQLLVTGSTDVTTENSVKHSSAADHSNDRHVNSCVKSSPDDKMDVRLENNVDIFSVSGSTNVRTDSNDGNSLVSDSTDSSRGSGEIKTVSDDKTAALQDKRGAKQMISEQTPVGNEGKESVDGEFVGEEKRKLLKNVGREGLLQIFLHMLGIS